MKAVVLEAKNKKSAVLKENGEIVKINREYQVGEEIELDEKTVIKKMPKRYIAIAASFILVCLLGTGGYVYAAPVSYVTVDVNPSFEFGLNRFDKVVSMKALNDDAKEIANQYNEQASFHPSLDEAISLTSELLYNSNYLGSNVPYEMTINAVSSNNEKSQALCEKAKEAVSVVEKNHNDSFNVSLSTATKEERNEAIQEGVSTGIYVKSIENQKNTPTDEAPPDVVAPPTDAPANPTPPSDSAPSTPPPDIPSETNQQQNQAPPTPPSQQDKP